MSSKIFILLVGSLVVCSALDTTKLCRDLLFLDCSGYTSADKDEQVCADGKTYNNFCEYSQAKCRFPSIEIQWIGSCHRFDPTTTPPTTPTTTPPSTMHPTSTAQTTTPSTTTTLDPLVAVFCANKDTIRCTTDINPICASNGQVYNNDCTFAKARCGNPSLSIQPLSSCQSG